MKKSFAIVISMFVIFISLGLAYAHEDTKAHPGCVYCGMDRVKFAHSRMLIEYDDGTATPFCSIHCAAVDLAIKIDKTPKSIMVGDYQTQELISAEKAFWVLGGSKMGVMTKRAKWAFAAKESADKFVSENGGKVIDFDEALKASYEDMNDDTKAIREKRKMRRMKSGK
jgi:nitrous oxide reductase accessory protein NosL